MFSSGLTASCVWLELTALRTSEQQFLISTEISLFQILFENIPSIKSKRSLKEHKSGRFHTEVLRSG